MRGRAQDVEVRSGPAGERLEAGENGPVDAAHGASLERRRRFRPSTLFGLNIALFDSREIGSSARAS